MEKIAIVTDSTCDVSPEELKEWGVTCINLKVLRADGTPFPDGNDAANIEEFYDYLNTCKELPGTSMPSPVEFGEVYSDLAKHGYTNILSMHIASAMSGTCTAARLAAETSSVPVEVLDTNRNTWALGLLVRYAATLRNSGARFATLVKKVAEMAPKANIVFALDTLKNLVKGGRTGKATGLAATLLDIKPILTVGDDGQVAQVSKAKSMKRAIPKLAEDALEKVTEMGPLEGYFVHARNLADVDKLRAAFIEKGVDFKELGVRQIGPVIATHVACGCVGFSSIPRDC